MSDPASEADSLPLPGTHAATVTRPPADPAATATFAPGLIGPFAGATLHARGGLGEVLRATDPTLNRTVAVKRLRETRAGDPAARRRFLVEAEVTARLEHPGVVPVYALYPDGEGGPAYAMRFVQGPTLGDAIRAYHTGPPDPVAFRRLLQSFIQACQTVAYAHSRGVIHRDLKPQNVLLGRFGETLVVDWGLAKVVGRPEDAPAEPLTEETLVPSSGSGDETAMGSAVGTPAYMSPEQAAGRWDVIDHRSDVYGLGAVLYTLLTGKPPLESGNWPDQQQRIQRGDFPPPRGVKADAPRPLEAVCLRAMALDPRARYPSAEALAADIEHWMADEPTTAYREPPAARARRWMRRHRTLMTAGVVLLVTGLAVAGAALFLLGQKNREVASQRNAAQRAADEARQAAAEAEAVNAFLTDDLLGQADPDKNARDRNVTVEELLAKAAARIEGNPKFADKPGVEATLRLTIGRTYFRLGNYAQAERHLGRALALRREAFGGASPLALSAQERLAECILEIRPQDAVPLARAAWEARTAAHGRDDLATLDSLNIYCVTLQNTGRAAETIDLLRPALQARRRSQGDNHRDTLLTTQYLAMGLTVRGEFAEAVRQYRAILAAPRGILLDSDYLVAASNLGFLQYVRGDLEESERLLDECVALSRRLNTADHLETDRLRGLLLRVRLDRGRVAEALTEAAEIQALRKGLYPEAHFMTANILLDLGRAQELSGRSKEAEASLAKALKVYTIAAPQSPYFVGWAEYWYARALTSLDRKAEAERHLIAAEEQLRATPMTPGRHYRQVVEKLIQFYDARDNPERAAEWRKRLTDLPGSGDR